jgi:hypothetical protein
LNTSPPRSRCTHALYRATHLRRGLGSRLRDGHTYPSQGGPKPDADLSTPRTVSISTPKWSYRQVYLAHKKPPPPPGSLSIPRHRAEVGSYGGLGSYERGTPVGLRGGPICPKAVDPLRGGPINAFRGGPLYPKAGQSTRKRAHPSRGGPIHLKESPSIRPEAVLS